MPNRRNSRHTFTRRGGILKRIAISQLWFQKKLNGVNFSALCRNLVRFGPVTPEFMMLKMTSFAAIRQKSAYMYHVKYLRISWTDLYHIYRFGRHMGGDDSCDIHLASAQGWLLWQVVKFGGCSHLSPWTTFTLCSGVRQRIRRSQSRFQMNEMIKWQ